MSGWTWGAVGRAKRDIKRLDIPVQRKVVAALDRLASTWPNSANVSRLVNTDPPEYRLRVGDWRVRFRVEAVIRVLAVLRVLKRGEAYER